MASKAIKDDNASAQIMSVFLFRVPSLLHSYIHSSPLYEKLSRIRLQRLKEMKQMSRDPLAAAKARKAERRADVQSGGITIKPVSLPSAETTRPTGFKKGGFKNAFGNADDGDDGETVEKRPTKAEARVEDGRAADSAESESDEEWGDYDPRRPTGCPTDCQGRG